jgi:hypothetical protein
MLRTVSTRTVVCAAGTLIGCLLGASSGRALQGQEQAPLMAEDVFLNVPVIRGIPVDEFMDTMGMFSSALSLNCVDCHTEESGSNWENYADETPLKRTARRMVQMVNAINRDNFGGRPIVTCYTCHGGEERPEAIPSLDVQYGIPEEDPNSIELFPDLSGTSADEVFDRYIQALGGEEALAEITSFAATGRYAGYDTGQQELSVEIFANAPDQRVTIVHDPVFGDSVRTFDGSAGWIAAPDRPVPLMTLTGGNLDGARIEGLLSFQRN